MRTAQRRQQPLDLAKKICKDLGLIRVVERISVSNPTKYNELEVMGEHLFEILLAKRPESVAPVHPLPLRVTFRLAVRFVAVLDRDRDVTG